VVLLLCRSGKRSALAAEAAAKAGFTQVFNVLEGFEGEIDGQQHRGGADGWRFHGCPGSRIKDRQIATTPIFRRWPI
jgi:rhodanese-related sulfurtransferase